MVESSEDRVDGPASEVGRVDRDRLGDGLEESLPGRKRRLGDGIFPILPGANRPEGLDPFGLDDGEDRSELSV